MKTTDKRDIQFGKWEVSMYGFRCEEWRGMESDDE